MFFLLNLYKLILVLYNWSNSKIIGSFFIEHYQLTIEKSGFFSIFRNSHLILAVKIILFFLLNGIPNFSS